MERLMKMLDADEAQAYVVKFSGGRGEVGIADYNDMIHNARELVDMLMDQLYQMGKQTVALGESADHLDSVIDELKRTCVREGWARG